MNSKSKEALKRIYYDAISSNEIEEDVEEIKNDYDLIKQDLDKLEQLEKENQGLKEAINILKEVSSLNCDKTLETERQFLRLTKEEYELLKSVFEEE